MLKTLITIFNAELKNMIFKNGNAFEKLQLLSEVDWVTECIKYTVQDLERDIEQYDMCITGWVSPKFTTEVFKKAKNLKFIGHTAGTVIPIVDKSVFESEIVVANANRILAKSTAECAVALMMAGAWNFTGYTYGLKNGVWSDNFSETVMGLYGQTIGLIGCGEISKEVIRLLQVYNPKILMNSRYCTQEEANRLGVELCELDVLLKESQIISLHNTLTPDTEDMLGERELNLIRDGALLVNTARAPIVNQVALENSLKESRYFAALDVHHMEPFGKDNILLQLPNVICLPHIGGYSNYWKTRLGLAIVEDIERFLNKQPLLGEITQDKFDRLTPK